MFVFSKNLREFVECSHLKKCSRVQKMFLFSFFVQNFRKCSNIENMFAFSNYSSQFLKFVHVFKCVFEFQNMFTCFEKCSKFVQYLNIVFTLSNIAQFFITLFLYSKRMIENSEKNRISVFTFFSSLRLVNVSCSR